MIEPEKKIKRIDQALQALKSQEKNCRLCPRNCGVNRLQAEEGHCGESLTLRIAYIGHHFGEEPVISGLQDYFLDKRKKTGGSGTIFFSGCNLKCLYCQNYQISWLKQGEPIDETTLAKKMLQLQAEGVFNINLVTPTHFLLPLLKALRLAYREGLKLPLVYNSSGYEKPETISLLDQIIDIYLPDLKYIDPQLGQKLSNAPDYFKFASSALQEMKKQQPQLLIDKDNIARQGVICRHLVLPGQLDNTRKIIDWLATHLSSGIGLSLMSQYQPCFKAPPEINRSLASVEYQQAIDWAKEGPWEILFLQSLSFASEEHLIPDFNRPDPFGWQK
ncbi:radical SAM protein [Candidatus Aminicenantes bacterium AC-334-K16]|jgi:putative pyruvate formate lyase activating enzyme|nr:radical SAM protein [Candidatus Aminicenantes bacterium AC-334-K16]